MRATAQVAAMPDGTPYMRVVVTAAPDLRFVRKAACPAQPVFTDFVDAVAQVVAKFRGDMAEAAWGTWVLCSVVDGVHTFTNGPEFAFSIMPPPPADWTIRFDNHGSKAKVGG